MRKNSIKVNKDNKDKKKTIPRFHLKYYFAIPLYFIFGMGILFSGMAIAPGLVSDSVKVFFEQPLLILLNALPVFAMLGLLWMAMGNLFFSAATTLAIVDVLAYINLLKIEGRDDPFIPADVFLLREGVTAIGEYELKQYPLYIAAIIVCTLVLVALGVFLTTAKPKAVPRCIAAVLIAAGFVISVPTLYADKDIYSSFKVPQQYNITSVFNTLGFNYCFLHNFNMYPIDKPDGYSASDVEKWMDEDLTGKSVSETRPNVVFIMCEAFSDIANDPSFDFPDGNANPLEAYNEIIASDRAYSGCLVVSNYGAGTANTEFDILTGLPTLMISEKTTSAFRTVRRNIASIPRVFADAGYNTYFMHPGSSWFYNRSSVYSYFGVDDQVFLHDAFSEADYKGGKVSDAAFLRVLKEDLTERFAAEEPLFAYSVTIQNHQAYRAWKYYDKSYLTNKPTSAPLSEDDMETLNVYLHGLRDSSEMLRGVCEFLDGVDEPTLLVFFGDHKPTLGADYSVYRGLGINVGNTSSASDLIETNTTPLLLWANEAYADEFKDRVNEIDLPGNRTISDHYLGAAVSELVGYAGFDPYYDFLNEARRTLPVVCGSAYMRFNGEATFELTDDEEIIVTKTNAYLYYRMKDGKATPFK